MMIYNINNKKIKINYKNYKNKQKNINNNSNNKNIIISYKI